MLAWLPEIKTIALFGYNIPTIFVFINLAFVAFAALSLAEAKRLKLGLSTTLLIVLLYYVTSQIISRLMWVSSQIFFRDGANNLPAVLNIYEMHKIALGGLVSIYLAILLGIYLTGSPRKKILEYFDIFSLGYVVLTFVLRIGGALSRYHPGKIIENAWASDNLFGNIRHEPSLYEAVSLGILFIISWLAIRKKMGRPGFLSLFILSWVGLSRVVTDFFRAQDLPESNFHFENGITANQIIYFIIFLASATTLYLYFKKAKKDENNPKNPKPLSDLP